MCERAATRDIGGGKMLGSRQVIQTWIAESRTEIDAARLLTLDAARQIDELGTHGARNAISAIKFFVAGILQKVVDRSIQVHGALGMTDDTILAWIFRHERAARIYDGPDEVHKMVVARRILREHGM
jgi:alkylation response protein AidB-like acyl-CoA dehydrogenase